MNIRSYTFWILDLLKGRPVGTHFADIQNIHNMNSADVKVLLQSRLTDLINHSCSTTKFYKKFESSIGIEGFPVINKTLIKDNFSEFRSSLFSDISRLSPMITSGSTGTPFKIFHDRNKRARNWADTIYFSNLAGYSLGEKLYYFKIWSTYNKKSWRQEWMQNIVPVDVLNLKENSRKILKSITQDSSEIHILGYASALETLCKVLDTESDLIPNSKIKSIITMSETLDSYTKNHGEKYFSCPILSRYSNIENGILAQQTLCNQIDFSVNIASYLIEIFDEDKDISLPYGEIGRIVVTDYFNYATPLIRYDTGDIGILEEKEIGGINRLYLTRIEGRKLDQIFNTNGDIISSYIVYKNMWKYTEIDQYQLIQKGKKDYQFKICAVGHFDREEELKNEFIHYLGQDASFTIEYVHDIPLLASGKRKKVINTMN